MIEITPEIIGPGIEEEYADARAAIDDMRVALGPQKLTNHTPEGRVLLEIKWIEQEIEARRLPIPVNGQGIRTILYLVGSYELGNVPGFQKALNRLSLVLEGDGLMKQRHVPVLIAMIDDFLTDAKRCDLKDEASREVLADIRREGGELERGGPWPKHRPPPLYFTVHLTSELKTCIERCHGRAIGIQASLFEGWRPSPARKPPLAAPIPGLPEYPPTLPPELEDQLP